MKKLLCIVLLFGFAALCFSKDDVITKGGMIIKDNDAIFISKYEFTSDFIFFGNEMTEMIRISSTSFYVKGVLMEDTLEGYRKVYETFIMLLEGWRCWNCTEESK